MPVTFFPWSYRAVELGDGTILLSGGVSPTYSGFDCTRTATELYYPEEDRWGGSGAMSTPRSGHTMTVLADGRVLVAGGRDCDGNYLSSAEIYDPRTGTWSSTGSMLLPHNGHYATLLSDGSVLIVGGYACTVGTEPGCGHPLEAERYEPSTGIWATAADIPFGVDTQPVSLQDGTVLARNSQAAALYDYRTDAWSATGTPLQASTFPTYQNSPAMTLLNSGQVLAAGGSVTAEGYTFRTNFSQLYNPLTRSWTRTGDMLIQRAEHAATLLPSGKVLVSAGDANGDSNGSFASTLNSAEIYDPALGSWSYVASLQTPRRGHFQFLLGVGHVFVLGGTNCYAYACNTLASTELFGPSAHPGPIVSAAELGSPSSSDPLLKRRLFITAAAATGGNAPAFVQYVWSQSSDPPATPDGTFAYSSTAPGFVDFKAASPNADWNLFVRALDADKSPGSWYQLAVHTPARPVWIGIGDSYTSGHHEDVDNPLCVTDLGCQPAAYSPNDPSYSWVSRAAVRADQRLSLPDRWLITPLVLGQSGASTAEFFGQGQVRQMQLSLSRLAGSWNVVSLTGGADDIRFSDVLKTYYSRRLGPCFLDRFSPACRSRVSAAKPWAVAKASECPNADLLYQRVTDPNIASTIRKNLARIVAKATASDPAVRIVDVDYPFVVNIDNVCFGDVRGRHGSASVINKLKQLHASVVAANLVHVDLRGPSAFGTTPMDHLQLVRLYGYPHPNNAGQDTIADAALAALSIYG